MRQQMIGIGVAALLVAGPVASAVIQDAKAAEILAASRKAIGDKKLEGMKSLSVQASIQRNVGNMQMQTESELLLELPDKYVKSDTSSGMLNMSMASGFNGDKAILPAGATATAGGGMMIRMGGGAAMADPHAGEKPTPEQTAEMHRMSVRNSRQEISRLMLGWMAMTHPTLKVQYSYVGEAESPDGKAHVVEAKDEDGFAARLFIDQNSKLPLMVTYKGRQPRVTTNRMSGPQIATTEGRPRQLSEEDAKKLKAEQDKRINEIKAEAAQPTPMVDFSLFFDDWREVDGVNFPHSIRRASEGATTEEWKINKVRLNPKIDAKKFAVVGTN